MLDCFPPNGSWTTAEDTETLLWLFKGMLSLAEYHKEKVLPPLQRRNSSPLLPQDT